MTCLCSKCLIRKKQKKIKGSLMLNGKKIGKPTACKDNIYKMLAQRMNNNSINFAEEEAGLLKWKRYFNQTVIFPNIGKNVLNISFCKSLALKYEILKNEMFFIPPKPRINSDTTGKILIAALSRRSPHSETYFFACLHSNTKNLALL